MLNSAEITIAHRKTYTIVDKCFRLAYLSNFWIKHPILAWNLHYGKQPMLPYTQDSNIQYKVLSNKWHIVAFFHREFPGIHYVPELISPATNAKVHKEMTMFFKHYAALEAARHNDYIMDNPKERNKRYTGPTNNGTTYQSRNGR